MTVLKLSNYAVDTDHLSRSLRRRREELGLTMAELGKKAAVAAATVHKLESGKLTVHFDKFLRVVDALDLKLDTLVSFKGAALPPVPDRIGQNMAKMLRTGDHASVLRILADSIGVDQKTSKSPKQKNKKSKKDG